MMLYVEVIAVNSPAGKKLLRFSATKLYTLSLFLSLSVNYFIFNLSFYFVLCKYLTLTI